MSKTINITGQFSMAVFDQFSMAVYIIKAVLKLILSYDITIFINRGAHNLFNRDIHSCIRGVITSLRSSHTIDDYYVFCRRLLTSS